jgi:hypothetical protein
VTRIPEKKILLTGEVQTFLCELLHLDDSVGVLRYVVNRSYEISGIKLLPVDITIALYWIDRPYTLYIWRLNQGKDTVYYFNIADRISLQPQEFIWRDLVVDVLVDTQKNVYVLDENELPVDLGQELARYIQSAIALLVREHRRVIHEADAIVSKLLLDKR